MMISLELYLAERVLDERVRLMLARTNAKREGRLGETGRQGSRFLGWLSLNLVALGARMVGYGLPARRSRGGQVV